jgi:hypothetical protein
MKCLKVTGTDSLVNEFVTNFSNALQKRKICVISESKAGKCNVSFPDPESVTKIMRSMPPDIVLVLSDTELAAPVVHCGIDHSGDGPLLLAKYNGEDSGIDYEDIYRKTFSLLPQRTAEECGRCGMDCMGLAEAILDGEKREEDCYYAASESVEVKLGGRLIELSEFPSSIIKGAVIGLVSSLKGYNDKEDISIRVKS